MRHRHPTPMLVAALLASAAGSAHAGERQSGPVMVGLGRWIAAQGDAALERLGDELRQNLHERLAPLLPAIDEAAAAHRVADPAPAAAPAQSL